MHLTDERKEAAREGLKKGSWDGVKEQAELWTEGSLWDGKRHSDPRNASHVAQSPACF